jgi:hypothetical protein
MKKASLLTALGLAVTFGVAAAPKANAEVIVGVRVATPAYVAPVYVAPVHYRYYAPRPFVAFRPVPVYRRYYVRPGFRARWYGRRFVPRREFYGWRR